MRIGSAGTLVRWVLLCALALGVLGMHHLSAPARGHDAVDGHGVAAAPVAHAVPLPMPDPGCCPALDPAPPAPDHGGGHDLLAHLCLAILAATVGIGLSLLLLWGRRARRSTGPPGAAAGGGRHPRPPPRPTSTRLASLCVLRL